MFYIRNDGVFIYELSLYQAVVVLFEDKHNTLYFWESRVEKEKIRNIISNRVVIEDEI